MRYSILALLLLLTGCDKIDSMFKSAPSTATVVAPCYVESVDLVEGKKVVTLTNDRGYKHVETLNGQPNRLVSHCIPCNNANSAAEKLACNGEGK